MSWPLTAQDLRSDAWGRGCQTLLHLATAIARDIDDSARPGEVLQKGSQQPAIEARSTRLVAFGQFAEQAKAASEHLANAGLFGTSAAIEAMSTCLASDEFDESLKIDLQRSSVLAWNFVDVAATLAKDPASKYFWQFRSTLRACHVLRAAAAIKPLLTKIASGDENVARRLDQDQRTALEDFGADVEEIVAMCIETLVNSSGSTNEAADGPTSLPSWMWRFGVEDQDEEPLSIVHGLDQAVYLASSVLVAVVRGASAGVVTPNAARDLFPAERRDWLLQVLLAADRPSDLDRRFALFGLWALSHLDEHNPALNPMALSAGDNALQFTVPDHLRLVTGFDHEQFGKQINSTLAEVFEDPLRLIEVQSDYRMVISDYRRDYFAVPVAPVAMMLSARYRPGWLFRRSLGRVIDRATSVASNGSCAHIPYQLSAGTNGIVFMSYLLGASCAVRRAMGRMKRLERARRWLPAVTYRDNLRGFAAAGMLMLLAGPGAYLLVEGSGTALGIWVGAWLGFAFNIAVVPLNRRLWRVS